MKFLKKIKNVLPSWETLKRTLLRVVSAFVIGALSAFVIVPVELENPKKYAAVLFIAAITGGLMGLQKFVSGYLKYDRKDKKVVEKAPEEVKNEEEAPK